MLAKSKVSLEQERYTYRRDPVLHCLAEAAYDSVCIAKRRFDVAFCRKAPAWLEQGAEL